MNFKEIAAGGGVVAVLMTLIQISPIQINPWSAIGSFFKMVMSFIGNAINGPVLRKMDEMEQKIDDIEKHFEAHEKSSKKDKADDKRASILHFNRELIRDLPHTMEDFIEVLSYIDFYENYCKEHPEYENNRAVMAIQNIERAYREHLEKHDFP